MDQDVRKKIYIKLFYSFLDWEWIDCPNTLVVFIHLLLNANRKPKRYGTDVIKAGEVLASYNFLAEKTGLSIQQVRTAIDHLIATHDITHRTINKTNVFTIVSYNKWQSGNTMENTSVTHNQHINNTSVTHKQHIDNISSTTPIYCKNEENEIMKECEEQKLPHGKLNNVYITDLEYESFKAEYPSVADIVIDELSEKIATGDRRYASGHIGHLFVFARNYTPEKKQEPKPFYDIDMIMQRSRNLDPTKTKRHEW